MRESCSCGAFISTLGYRRVKLWRKEHKCVGAEPELEPDKQGAQAQVEHAGYRGYEHSSNDTPVILARIGFTPND